ncbi:MAG: ribonuclease III [Deltaproteobacteria bacterium]|nr:ribonuclease III [Deltaproteobacteria bacterium]
MKYDLDDLVDVLGHRFRDPSILINALTHSSYHNEHPDMPSNERLEFLGDSILGFVVSEMLFRSYPGLDEGPLTARKASVVGGAHLGTVSRRIGLERYLLLGQGEQRQEDVKHSILADALEAVIAAVFLDGGIRAARSFVRRHLGAAVHERDENLPRDFKSELQARVLADAGALPHYRLLEEAGPDHLKEFVFEASMPGGPCATGTGLSKKAAQQAAAAALLEVLEEAPR